MINRECISINNIKNEVEIYTISNGKMSIKVTNYGAILLSLCVSDKDGNIDDIVLGHRDMEKYTKVNGYFGATVGRYANRINNASFTIEGVTYNLNRNNGNNHIHGGEYGFDRAIWNAEIKKDKDGEFLELSYLSKDGEENYPGNLLTKVIYRLSDKNELIIDYYATTDKTTVVNLTNHSYFNLKGHNKGNILDHKVKIISDYITETNKDSIPTGIIRNIKNTPMDFNDFKAIGKDIKEDYDQLNFANGYDHNYIVNENMNGIKKIAEVIEESTKRCMEVYTTMPGVQFYTGNFLGNNVEGKDGAIYSRGSGFCLETQYYPDSPNNINFPSPILKPKEEYKHRTIYKFSCI